MLRFPSARLAAAALTAGSLVTGLTAVPAGAAPPLASAPTGPVAVQRPAHNYRPVVNFDRACYVTGTPISAGCTHALLTDINHARAAEHVRPMVLPRNYGALSGARQLFVVSNLERVDRGLRPQTGMVPALDSVAAAGAARNTDPWLRGWTVGDVAVHDWGSNWAGAGNALMTDWLWMYADGYAGARTTNDACSSPGAAGCWGHRANILRRSTQPLLITGTAATMVGHSRSYAQIFVAGHGRAPRYAYTWAQARAAGAGR
jgi:hypothetical protein